MSRFVRPASLEFPLVFHTFKAKDNESDEIIEYRIQDLPEEDYARAVDLMISDFVPEETLCACRGIQSDAEGIEDLRNFWANELKTKISVACYKNVGESKDLVGLNVLAVVSDKDTEDEDKLKSAAAHDIFEALHYVQGHHNVFHKYGVSQFLTDYGLVTNKNYRKLGIATEFLKARVFILKALNLQVTSTIFTVIGSQRAAIKANYGEIFSIDWRDVGKIFKDFDFTKSNARYCKILDFKI